MLQKITSNHWNDSNGNPAGGCTFGPGFAISWQNGPLGRGNERLEPNGAFVESVIEAAKDRLEYYEQSKFRCGWNSRAINYLKMALSELNERTQHREKAGTEGTHA